MLARDRAFLMMPVGSGGLYCYADRISHGAEDKFSGNDATERGSVGSRVDECDRLRALFSDFAEPVPHLLAQLGRVDVIHAAPSKRSTSVTASIGASCSWATPRMRLPNMAQGASMALEDALVLADALSSGDPTLEALAAFAVRRRARVRWVQQRTHHRDRIRDLPSWLRNLSLRMAGRRSRGTSATCSTTATRSLRRCRALDRRWISSDTRQPPRMAMTTRRRSNSRRRGSSSRRGSSRHSAGCRQWI
jgi:hypothetical protein